MKLAARVLFWLGTVITAVGVVMGYVGGVRADESRPLGITAWMWPVFFGGIAVLIASLVVASLYRRRLTNRPASTGARAPRRPGTGSR